MLFFLLLQTTKYIYNPRNIFKSINQGKQAKTSIFNTSDTWTIFNHNIISKTERQYWLFSEQNIIVQITTCIIFVARYIITHYPWLIFVSSICFLFFNLKTFFLWFCLLVFLIVCQIIFFVYYFHIIYLFVYHVYVLLCRHHSAYAYMRFHLWLFFNFLFQVF